MGYNMNQNCILPFTFEFFLENMSSLGAERGERFLQDVATIEKRYQGRAYYA